MNSPDEVVDRIEQVWRLEATGASDDAQDLLDRLVTENPGDPQVHMVAGTYYVYSRKDVARRALQRVRRLAPTWIEAYAYLAASHQVGRHRRWALEYARRGQQVAHRHWGEVSPREYAELLFEEAEAHCARGDRSSALRALRRGLARLGGHAHVAGAIGNLEACRVDADRATVADTLRDALDVARFQSARGKPIDHSPSESASASGRRLDGPLWRVVHKGWGSDRPPLLCFANHGANTIRTFRCWECGASHGQTPSAEGPIELHVDHAGPWPDLLDHGTLVSTRVSEALRIEGVRGYRAHRVVVKVKGRPDLHPGYSWLDVPVSVAIDWKASGFHGARRCEACGAYATRPLRPRRGLRLLAGGTDGPELFRCAWDRGSLYVGARVVALARAEGWTGFRFVPSVPAPRLARRSSSRDEVPQ